MPEDNILPFPDRWRNAIDEQAWQALQGEFYLDCFFAHHGRAAEDPDELRAWLNEVKLFADTENPFFRGWLMRRLSEPNP